MHSYAEGLGRHRDVFPSKLEYVLLAAVRVEHGQHDVCCLRALRAALPKPRGHDDHDLCAQGLASTRRIHLPPRSQRAGRSRESSGELRPDVENAGKQVGSRSNALLVEVEELSHAIRQRDVHKFGLRLAERDATLLGPSKESLNARQISVEVRGVQDCMDEKPIWGACTETIKGRLSSDSVPRVGAASAMTTVCATWGASPRTGTSCSRSTVVVAIGMLLQLLLDLLLASTTSTARW